MNRFSYTSKTLLLLTVWLATSCTGDYNFSESLYTPRPVVISMITPDSAITVSLYRSKPPTSSLPMEKIGNASVVIKEDGEIIAEGQSENGMFKSNIKPSVGKSYELLVNIPGEPQLSATTSIPAKPEVKLSTRGKIVADSYSNVGYVLVEVPYLKVSIDTRGVWITADAFDNSGKSSKYMREEYYSSNSFFDQINATVDPKDVLLRESNVIFERSFIRISGDNIPFSLPFTFAYGVFWEYSVYPGDDYSGTPIKRYTNRSAIYILAASAEYDRFRRSAERQWQNSNSLSPLMKDPSSVQSNIKNGLGIFGGYSVSTLKTSLKKPQKK